MILDVAVTELLLRCGLNMCNLPITMFTLGHIKLKDHLFLVPVVPVVTDMPVINSFSAAKQI